MISRTFKTIGLVVLGILPYSTILSNFSPYWTTHTFQDFLVASLIFAFISVMLAWIICTKNLFKKESFCFFMLGMITAPPLMLGPPEQTPKLLDRVSEEHFRYGMLILATVVFIAGFIVHLKKIWKEFSFTSKLILIPFVICTVLLIWDNFSSHNFAQELKNWISDGKKAEDFFANYNFHEFFRTLGRSLLYVLTAWLGFILFKRKLIRKWQAIFLLIFSSVGILFFLLYNLINPAFYFPFMVPAVAMAPAYWVGLMLTAKRKSSPQSISNED